jgi:hypothetical protein
MNRSPSNRNNGVILLVVLGMLTFFSLLTAAYLVFSNQSRQASFAIASRNVKQSNPNALLDEAMMTLLRGTSVPTSPFFGEDMLSDFYGRTDFMGLRVRGVVGVPATAPYDFIRVRVEDDPAVAGGQTPSPEIVNDLYTGRIITFTSGNLRLQSFRVLRSITTTAGVHDLVFATNAEMGSVLPSTNDTIWMNGVPRSSRGLGFTGTEINGTVASLAYTQPNPAGSQASPMNTTVPNPVGIGTLPVTLQPNHLGGVSKSVLLQNGSDFDESFDAADFNNWFLAYKEEVWRDNNSDGIRDPDELKIEVTPSFHRPSVINYILNEHLDWETATRFEYMNTLTALARATMRPLPIARNQFTPDAVEPPADPTDLSTYSLPRNGLFTGGNENFALRTPILLRNPTLNPPFTAPTPPATAIGPPRLNQLAEALINGPWDVDTDFDGVADSNWMDIDLPVFTSPEGKLLKPLIAPMITDLSGRLNVNAHGNYALINQAVGVNEVVADWAKPAGSTASQFAFRGVGYGPADINIPGTAPLLYNLLRGRYQLGSATSEQVPGRSGADALATLTSGWRPASLVGAGVYSNSVDPYGRGGFGLSLSGAIVPANDGNTATISATDVGETLGDDPTTATVIEPTTNEIADNPYELDPTGRLGGDQIYTEDELEAIVRANEFDSELLPSRLVDLMRPLIVADPSLARAITTTSTSDDSPHVATTSATGAASAYDALRSLIGGTLTNAQLNDLVAPELRLAKKLDINRRFGNGVDDNGNGVVDEPREYDVSGYDDDGNGTVDDTSEATGTETEAFQSYAGATVDAGFLGVAPDYVRDDSSPVPPRQLLARHLYVLMMLISRDLNSNNFPSYGDTITPTPVPVSNRNAYRARRIAQWAVNVVDYRDPDAIMTRFAYDPNPFDGWAVAEDMNGDGVLQPSEIFGTSATPPTSFSPVVWGCEQPDLLFSESFATHDIRARDTDLDTTNKKGSTAPDTDDDLDQVRIPEGSLFLELYNPRRNVTAGNLDPNTAGIPRELYDVNTGGANVTYTLDLERTITSYSDGVTWGDTTTAAAEVPVWRIAISEPHFNTGNSPLDLRATLPDTLSFQPELGQPNSLDELNVAAHNLSLERFVFFNNYANTTALQAAIAPIPDMTQPASVFFNSSGVNASLSGEQYLCLAPRLTTNLGSVIYATGPTAPSDQGFEIRTTAAQSGLIQFDETGAALTPSTSVDIQPGLGLAISAFAPSDWTNAATTKPNGIGLNVSEPLSIAGNYYAEPQHRYINLPAYPDTDAYVELDAAGTAAAGAPVDRPEDMRVNGPIRQLTLAYATDPATVADPMIGSVANYRTAFLQRLADPTRGFHPVLNPYRTIDQIAIDLTIFSGEEIPTNVLNPGNMPSTPTTELPYLLGSRQRNGVGVNGVGTHVLYSYSTLLPATVGSVAASTNYYSLTPGLNTTFNYLNSNFGTPVTTPFRGRPPTPFAIHPWLNRPYATPHELMMVPACSQGRLLEEFSVIDPALPDPAIFPEGDPATTDTNYAFIFQSPFRHLLNFFNSKNIIIPPAIPPNPPIIPAPAGEFATLFDYVGTPPRYRGESEAILPSLITGTPLAPLYSAPFNFIEGSRRIGKVNLNTIEEFAAWKGLMQGHMNAGEFSNPAGGTSEDQLAFDEFRKTRRGYIPPAGAKVSVIDSDSSTPVNYDPNRFDPRFPTQFAGVFRRTSEGEFSPELRDLTTSAADDSELLRRRNVNAGLLRGEGTVDNQETGTGGTAPTHTSLFVRASTQNPQTATNLHQDRNRNAFLKYQTLARMPNLVSDNSQTFLVRIVLGFFEVDASNTNNLGAEYNEQKGENRRYSAMFIIDRSIPVGFIPGQDVNARDTVIYERFYQ